MTSQGIDRFILPHIHDAEEYVPILPLDVLSAEIGIPVDQLVKLDANENPYGTSPAVLDAIAGCLEYHIYPDPGHEALRGDLAVYTGCLAEKIVCGAGADELIDLLYRILVAPGQSVIDVPPTFGMYRFSAGIGNAVVKSVPRNTDFRVDVPAVLAAIDDTTRIIWLTSPNNPTGTPLAESDLLRLLETGLAVVVDEAYAEFSGTTYLPLTERYDNLIILRTFSKWAGLAGLRVGYGVFPVAIAQALMKAKPPYNVNVAAMVAARAALADMDYHRQGIAKIVAERSRLLAGLRSIPYLHPYESDANFILCRVVGANARQVRDTLRAQGILIRHYSTALLADCIRVSVGRPDHTDRIVAVLADLRVEDLS